MSHFQKLTPEMVAMIRLRYITRAATQSDMAKEYGVSYWTIHHHISRGKRSGYPFGSALNNAAEAWARKDYAAVGNALRCAANLVSGETDKMDMEEVGQRERMSA